ncbi:sel1 repeat family protein [Billgrantia sulfidoxydans]|uniref:Sel1 repeat family protein n=1 Tax=Billgrantia sulfidoxydans TaxID=2733484 RepID=A0ABX7W8G8_9GAMM|nr:tetratricopeptide repeat protein [Halomonas sulfidoxydans]QTP55288.1 sel1 repeat family protein [Halomonas sulfidoxydans]
MRLYNIHKRASAIPYLEEAAEAGDVEIMYYLGEAHRLRHMRMTREALDWYHMAAQEGDPYAMLRLESGNVCKLGGVCPEAGDNWAESALNIVLPQAEDGDAEAMGTLFHVYLALGEHTEAVDWLKSAAETHDPVSQYVLGVIIQEDEDYIPDEEERLGTAERWLQDAAEQGYVPAMDRLAMVMRQQGRDEEAWTWLVKASEGGHKSARGNIGWCLLNPEERGEDFCPPEEDRVKGWAILFSIHQETGDRASRNIMSRNRERLTEEEIEEAEAQAQEWLGKGPPLSEYPPRYGF